MSRSQIALATAVLVLLLGSAGIYLDGPSDLDAERATAAAARDVERFGALPLSHSTSEGQP